MKVVAGKATGSFGEERVPLLGVGKQVIAHEILPASSGGGIRRA
jgi:hypothetical protein